MSYIIYRPDVVFDSYAGTVRIPLTKGLWTVIDIGDYPLAKGFWWLATQFPHAARVDSVSKKWVFLHNLILPCEEGFEVDHRDGDGLNNRRSNLRKSTHAQNLSNQKLSIRNKSGFKGVYWSKDKKKWAASIKTNGKHMLLGRFHSKEDAVIARRKAEETYFGEFRRSV